MSTVIEILKKTTAYFKAKGIENARVDAEWLLAEVLAIPRMEVYLQFDRCLQQEELDRLRTLVRRRGQNREPLQYLIGTQPFSDVVLKVDRRALIPRPETEELVEWVVEKTMAHNPTRILDLGCGSGAIAIALSKKFPQSQITAVDSSSDALALTQENLLQNQVADRITLVPSDWGEELTGRFDLIVSNPPYLTKSEWEDAEPEVRLFEPREALVAEEKGIASIRKIIHQAPSLLDDQGYLFLETGIDHQEAVETLFSQNPWGMFETKRDIHHRFRYAMGKKGFTGSH